MSEAKFIYLKSVCKTKKPIDMKQALSKMLTRINHYLASSLPDGRQASNTFKN